jgi:hypothetical protein
MCPAAQLDCCGTKRNLARHTTECQIITDQTRQYDGEEQQQLSVWIIGTSSQPSQHDAAYSSSSLSLYHERSNEFVSSTEKNITALESTDSRQSVQIVSSRTPTTTTTTTTYTTSYCKARSFGCAYRQNNDDDVTAHEWQCSVYISNRSLIDEMIAKGTWDAICPPPTNMWMEGDKKPAALSDPKLKAMDEMCLKVIEALNAQRVLLRHLDLVAAVSRKTYSDAVCQTCLTVNKILLSSGKEAADTGSGPDPFNEAIKAIIALKQVKQTLFNSIENRVCEQLDITDASLLSVLDLHKRYKEQVGRHRLPLSLISN